MLNIFAKIDVRRIIVAHYATLYDFRARGARRLYRWDVVGFVGLPLIVGGIVWQEGLLISDVGSLLSGIALFGGLLFALLILLLQQAADASGRTEDEGNPSKRTMQRVESLKEISANVAYSILVSLLAVAFLVSGLFVRATRIATVPSVAQLSSTIRTEPMWLTVVLTIVLTHLFLTILMVMKRTFSILTTEADRAVIPPRRG